MNQKQNFAKRFLSGALSLFLMSSAMGYFPEDTFEPDFTLTASADEGATAATAITVTAATVITAENYGDYGFTASNYKAYLGYYAIENAGNLYWFAGLVNGTLSGVKPDYAANVVLTKDITVNANLLESLTYDEDGNVTNGSSFTAWFPIGYLYDIDGDGNLDSASYQGKFDGQNHTISGLYFNNSTQSYVGLFGYTSTNAEIKNVGIVGSYINAGDYVGGVCGENYEGIITNCYNTGTVSASDAYSFVGGVCGHNSGTLTNCYSTGAVSASADGTYIGGVCGYNSGTLANCYSTGAISTSGSGSYALVGGVCGYNDGTLANSYASGSITTSGDYACAGGVCGYNDGYNDVGTISNAYYSSTAYSGDAVGLNDNGAVSDRVLGKTTTAFASGEVAYLLAQGCTIGEGEDAVTYSGENWGQMLTGENKQDYPVIDGEIVIRTGVYMGVYMNVKAPAQITAENYETYGFTAENYASYVGYYAISSASELYWFAGLVNGTITGVSQNTSANAVLTKDITVNANLLKSLTYDEDGNVTNGSSFTAWFPIGYSYDIDGDESLEDIYYQGEFDGQNHTISGLYFDNSEQDIVGLFGQIQRNAKIKNVGVVDSYFKGRNMLGGVCGWSNGKITNSYHIGAVSGTNDVGGVCGYNNGTITNSYHIGAVSGTNNAGGVCERNYGTIANCYYDSTVYSGNAVGSNNDGTVSDSVLGKTTTAFASGEVAYLLSQGCTIGEGESAITYSGSAWGQTLTGENKQDHPVLGGVKVYENATYTGCNDTTAKTVAYSNTQVAPVYGDHNYANGKCTVCGAFEDGIGAQLAGHSLSLSGNIGVNFYMELDADVIADTGAYMQFTLPNNTTSKVYVKDVQTDTTTTAGTTYYVFSCEVAAKEMYDTITAQIILSDGASSDAYTFKVEDYANYILDDENSFDQKTKDLVTAMLSYGNYAKAYFNEEALVATTEMESIMADTLSDYAFTATGTLPEGIAYYGSTLILESETAIRHYFRVAEGTDISAYDMTAKDGFYYVQISNIAADDLGTAQTTTISDFTISYSALSYVYAALNSEVANDSLQNLLKALALYEQAATAYQAME